LYAGVEEARVAEPSAVVVHEPAVKSPDKPGAVRQRLPLERRLVPLRVAFVDGLTQSWHSSDYGRADTK
jgi:hypothetical protein